MPSCVCAPDFVFPSWQYAVAVAWSVWPARGVDAAANASGVDTAISATTTAIRPAVCIARDASSGMPPRAAEPPEKDEHERGRDERSPPPAQAECAHRIRPELRDHEHDRSGPGERADQVQH